jgi:exodeoxyribonuclease V gamma subunit
VLTIVVRDSYSELVNELALRLSTPLTKGNVLERALAPEWVVTPSVGTRQWLRRELGERVGASDPGRRDGVVANWRHEFPGALIQRVLAPHLRETVGRDRDPWSLPELTFQIMEWSRQHHADEAVQPLLSNDGSTLMARARHFADLFDRYHVWRPEMITAWAEGRLIDPTDRYEQEQFAMWRALRKHLDVPSPPERWSSALQRLEIPDVAVLDDWPNKERLSVFGVTAFPGGMRFIETVAALAGQIDVAIYLVHGFDDEVLRHVRERSDFRSELLQMWGGLPLANAPIINALLERADVVDREPSTTPAPDSLLTALHHTLRRDEVIHVTEPSRPSVVEHWCHGPMRQAEVLRDAIRHDLETSSDGDEPLSESDILVVCSDIELFAPLIRTAFGAPRTNATESPQPALAYRVSDPRLTSDGAYLRAVRQALQLVRSRCTRSEVLSLLEAPPVAARRRLVSDELDIISAWTESAGIRWGLSPAHRAQFGLGEVGDVNTWRAGLKRLYLGATVLNPNLRDVRGVLPVEVLAGRIDLLGNVTEVIDALEEASALAATARSLSDWLTWFDRFISILVAPVGDDQLEATRVTRALSELREIADEIDVDITFAEFIDVLDGAWSGSGGVSRLLTGGITVTSPDTLRWIPFRAVYVVGFDDEAFSRPEWEPDDLRRRERRPGDITPNDDARSRLSEILLSTSEKLTIFRNYRDLSNNKDVEFGTAFAEYRQAVGAILHGSEPLVIQHPRHGFSRENFDPHSKVFSPLRAAGVIQGSWSHSTLDYRVVIGAVPPQGETDLRVPRVIPFGHEVSLRDLARFLRDPVTTHLAVALGVRVEDFASAEFEDLDVEISNLRLPLVLRRLFDYAMREEKDPDLARQALVKSGDIPPEHFGGSRELAVVAQQFAAAYQGVIEDTQRTQIRLDVPLDGLVVIDDLEVMRQGSTLIVTDVRTSKFKLKHVFEPWIRAVAVRAATPDSTSVELCVVTLCDGVPQSIRLPVLINQEGAVAVLNEVGQLYRVNASSPLPFDNDALLTERWSSRDEELWQGKTFQKHHRFLGKPEWRLLFGEMDVREIGRYEPLEGWGIRNILSSLQVLLTRVVDVSLVIDTSEDE